MIWIGVVWTCTMLETTHTNIDEKEAKQKKQKQNNYKSKMLSYKLGSYGNFITVYYFLKKNMMR